MKVIICVLFLIWGSCKVSAQNAGTIVVAGDINKYYPVAWKDENFHQNRETSLKIGRSYTHEGGLWTGALMANFDFHVSNGGHQANYIHARIATSENSVYKNFIGGWADATTLGEVNEMIVWLRGNTTYHYSANADVSPKIYDGVTNGLPYVTAIGAMTFNIKDIADSYVKQNAVVWGHPVHVPGAADNYFAGNVGIGTSTPAEKLAVNGNIRAKEIKVEAAPWPDYVFEEDYKLGSLTELEQFVKANKHLPGVPKAADVEEHGLSLGEMNRILMQKVEELTLHLIEKDKDILSLKKDMEVLKKVVSKNNNQ